jgi:diguanylate cyclase (GGDEF)-like protein/PAS domain S-box-containing protein
MSEPSPVGSQDALERAERAGLAERAERAERADSPPAEYAGRPRDAQLEYKAILANASIGIAFTRDRKFTLCNPKFAEMLGWKAEELIGQPGDIVYPSRESYEALGAIAMPVLAAGRQLDVEWEVRRMDGSTFLARLIAKAVNEAETQKGTVWILEDITARKRQADQVARLLREQEAILNTASIGICFVRDRRIVRATRRFEQMHGYAPGEMEGQATAATYADQAAYRAIGEGYGRLRSGESYSAETLTRRKDGSTYWSRITGRAVDAADPSLGSVWMDEDITERKRAEEDLQRVLAEQQVIVNNVVIGIAFLRDRSIVRCNPRFEELFGFERGEANGMSTRQYYFTDEDFAAGGRYIEQLDAGSTPDFEQWLRRKDGSGFWCRRTGRAIEPGNLAKGYVWMFEDITARKSADEEIRRLAEEQRLILDNATVGIAFVRNHVVQRCNRYLEEMIGVAPGGLIGQPSSALFADQREWEQSTSSAYRQTEPGGTRDLEARFQRADGSTFLGRTRGRRIDAGGAEQEWIWSLEDVTVEREAEARIRRALVEQELILTNATVGIVFARNRVLQRCNPRFEQMFGYGRGEMIGKTSEDLFASASEYASVIERLYADMAATGAYAIEQQVRRKDGSTFWCKVVAKAIDPKHPEEGAISIYEDITAERAKRESLEASRDAAEASKKSAEASRDALEHAVAERTVELQAANERLQAEIADRRQAETRAQHLADHDPLTGLPNRRLLEDRLTQALAASQRNSKQTAVMFVDLDRFKNINDSLGHAAGDQVLKEVAERLVKQLRVVDTICRIGGDEFVVVLPEIKRASDAANVAAKILEAVALPFLVDERELNFTSSIGISVFPDDGRDAESLIRNADAAMYHAKETGRANYQFFTEQMNQAAARRLSLEADLRQAVLNDELRAWVQPVVEAASGRIASHEALLRWQHPSRGVIEPAEFISLADDTGLIQRMGDWLLGNACRWAVSLGVERGLPVSINLSARQFHDPKLAETVARALKESGLPPQLLELEVAETTVMQNTDVALSVLHRLRELGVGVVIDGFGAAYSSLVGLHQLPVNKLKIDRALVAEVSRQGKGIIVGIVGLAHALELKVTAVGVETEAQRGALKASGCDYLQGFLTGKPVDGETAAQNVANLA